MDGYDVIGSDDHKVGEVERLLLEAHPVAGLLGQLPGVALGGCLGHRGHPSIVLLRASNDAAPPLIPVSGPSTPGTAGPWTDTT